jgi:DNA-binding MarR family transcriptional regulator
MADEDRSPLDPVEQRQWYALSYLMVRLPAELDAYMQRVAGISHFEYLVLSGLAAVPGRTQRMSDLARYTASALPRLSNVITRLEKRGWVQRRPDPHDGRFTLAALTPDGLAKVHEVMPDHVSEVRRVVLDPLTKAQRRDVAAAAQRILQTIDPTTPTMDECVVLSEGTVEQ